MGQTNSTFYYHTCHKNILYQYPGYEYALPFFVQSSIEHINKKSDLERGKLFLDKDCKTPISELAVYEYNRQSGIFCGDYWWNWFYYIYGGYQYNKCIVTSRQNEGHLIHDGNVSFVNAQADLTGKAYEEFFPPQCENSTNDTYYSGNLKKLFVLSDAALCVFIIVEHSLMEAMKEFNTSKISGDAKSLLSFFGLTNIACFGVVTLNQSWNFLSQYNEHYQSSIIVIYDTNKTPSKILFEGSILDLKANSDTSVGKEASCLQNLSDTIIGKQHEYKYNFHGKQYILIDHQDNRFSLKENDEYLFSYQVLQRVICNPDGQDAAQEKSLAESAQKDKEAESAQKDKEPESDQKLDKDKQKSEQVWKECVEDNSNNFNATGHSSCLNDGQNVNQDRLAGDDAQLSSEHNHYYP